MHVLTENEIRNVASRIEAGGTFTLPPETILTPLARDYLRARSIHIVEQNGRPPEKFAVKAAPQGSDDALVSAVADEVSRILREGAPATAKSAAAASEPAPALPRKTSGESGASNRAVVWGIGGDRPGILAAVAELLGRRNANILEINQTILSGVFAMVVIIDLQQAPVAFAELKSELESLGKKLGINLSAQRDEIFQYMHRV